MLRKKHVKKAAESKKTERDIIVRHITKVSYILKKFVPVSNVSPPTVDIKLHLDEDEHSI